MKAADSDNNLGFVSTLCWNIPDWRNKSEEYLAEQMKEIVTAANAKESYPMKSFFDAGVCFVNSSDRPCDAGTFYPFGCMQVGVTCKSTPVPEDTEWWPEEKLSREQALQAMTINGAYLAQTENERGSITKGKWADFIVIDQDVLNCPAMEIAITKVLKTYFEGKQVY